ncbi:putative reverse transcriptase domain-containing protein [Tanacetum coccineum]
MYYPRFTKVIINHFMSKDQSIPRRNKVDWHMANNDPILTTMRFIPKHETVQKYDAILPDTLTNQAMKESDTYKTYHDFTTGKVKDSKSYRSVLKSGKKKLPAQGLETLSKIALSEAERMKIVTKRSKTQFHSLTSEFPDDMTMRYKDDDGQDNDNEQTESDNDGDDFIHPKFSTHDEEERQDKEDKDKEGSDLRVQTPSHFESTYDETYDEVTQGNNVEGEKLDEEERNEDLIQYLANKMNEAVKIAVQLQSDRLRDEAQAENEDSINKLDENIKNIIKKQVKVQVKDSTEESLQSIDDEDEDEEPSVGSNWGSKRRRAGKEPESISAPKEKTSKSTGKSKEGYKSHQKATGKSAQAEEPIHADEDLEEPAYQEEFARDVYSRNRIIGIKKLTIVEWRNYKHLEWITVCRDDDKLYTFKEGNYNRLRLQDIEDMLLLLVQGKLTNLNIEERLALGVSLRMFTRSIIIRSAGVEDLNVASNVTEKKLTTLQSPDTYRFQLMCIDELHKFSDGTLNNVRSALDDILKRIRMEYLPQTVWRNVDRERAGAMIQAIDRQLKNRRLMRSLEKFSGGSLSILTDSKVTPTKHEQMTKPYSPLPRFIANYFNEGYLKMEVKIMPPRMRTQSVGRPAAKSLGGGTGVQVGRGNDQWMGANRGVEEVNGNVKGANEGAPDFLMIISQQLQNLLPAMLALVGVLAFNPKEYDGKGGVEALTRWIKKMEYVQDMSGCSVDQNHEMQKLESELWNHAMVGAGHAAYTDRFHELARLVPYLVTPESRMIKSYVYGLALHIYGMVAAIEPKTIHKALQISGALTDEAVRNGSIKKVEKRGNMGEPSKDKHGRDDNKRTRTGNAFATTANPIGRENTGTWPKCTTYNSYHAPGGPYRTCFNCNRLGHLAKDYRGVSRNVNPVNARNPTVRAYYECGSTDHVRSACRRLNRAQGPKENHPNQVVANNGGQGHRNQGNQARGRAFMLGAEEDTSELGFKYDIEIASGQLVEIDKVIKGCRLEIEGHVFDIELIPFGHGSFDVIIGMDWLPNYKAEIICHEKVVRIPLPDDKVLRVLGEGPEEKARFLMGAKAGDKKQEEIVVVRDFPKVFLNDLSGLSPIREINFRIELIPGATPVAKSPYCLAPSELEELS